MGLFLPQPPAPDSDEEEDPEGAAAHRSRASIPMDAGETPVFLMLLAALYSMHYRVCVRVSGAGLGYWCPVKEPLVRC